MDAIASFRKLPAVIVRPMRKLLLGSAAVLAFGIASAGAERWEPSQEDFKQMQIVNNEMMKQVMAAPALTTN